MLEYRIVSLLRVEPHCDGWSHLSAPVATDMCLILDACNVATKSPLVCQVCCSELLFVI